MSIRYLTTKLAFLLLVGSILAGGYGLVRADPQEVTVSVSTDKTTYGWGETVTITVSVTNVGSSTLDFVFATYHQAGCSIYMEHGQTLRLVWTTLDDVYIQLESYLTLEPGETENYVFHWEQVSETNTKIKPATFVIQGYFVGTWTWSSSEFDIKGHGYREN